MIYIIEGSNKVGKTTGIKAIETSNEKIVINNRYVNGMMLDRNHDSMISAYSMLDFVKSLSELKKVDIYIDRFHLSEFTYGLLCRGYVNKFMIDIDNELSKIDNLMLVLVKSSYNHIVEDGKDFYFAVQNLMTQAFFESKIKNKKIVKSDYFVKGEVSW